MSEPHCILQKLWAGLKHEDSRFFVYSTYCTTNTNYAVKTWYCAI